MYSKKKDIKAMNTATTYSCFVDEVYPHRPRSKISMLISNLRQNKLLTHLY